MKLSRKQIGKEPQSPAKVKTGVVQVQVGKSTNRARGQNPKPAEKIKKALGIEPVPEQRFHPSSKIKLQLFPVDDITQRALEKDGFHPYLELTLSAKKKISSVVKHLNYKWGGSSIARGEPALFPYIISSEDFSSLRWTLIDDNVTAGDVYMSIGSPSTFRLRYGWLSSDSENKPFGMPTSTPLKSTSQPEGVQHGSYNNLESKVSKQKQAEVTSEDLKATILSGSGAEDASGADETPSNGLVDPMNNNEVKMHVGIGQTSSSPLWDDSLTNISVGGLLSEASLQGMFSSCNNPKPDGSIPPQLISDSFDAFLMAQANYSQAPRLPPHGSTSSILDAEDTCHAFAFPKNPSTQDSGFKSSFKHPNNSEVNVQPSISQGRGCQESETELSLCSRIYQDESSLGLSGIKWNDSLGPFDLFCPSSSSRKIINGDSISMSRIFS